MKRLLGALFMVTLMGVIWGGNLYAEDLIRVKGKYWFNEVDGNVKADNKVLAGADLDFTKDLNLDERASVPELELKLKLGMNKFIGSYWKSAYEGKETLTQNINFGGKTFTATELVKSKLTLEVTSLIYERVFIPEFLTKALPSVAEAEAGLLVGVEYFSSGISLASSLNAKDETGSAPLPVIGLFLQLGFLDTLKAEVGAMGFGAKIGDVDARFMDVYVEVKINVLKTLPLGIGYKVWGFKLTDDDTLDINLGVKGYYLFATYEF